MGSTWMGAVDPAVAQRCLRAFLAWVVGGGATECQLLGDIDIMCQLDAFVRSVHTCRFGSDMRAQR